MQYLPYNPLEAAIAGILMIICWAAVALRRQSCLRTVLVDERGAAYSLSLLMVLPIFVTLLALLVEMVNLTVARLGCSYAADTAARSAVVWSPTDVASVGEPNMAEDPFSLATPLVAERCRLAAARTLVPFTSCRVDAEQWEFDAATREQADSYAAAYATATARADVDGSYFRCKFLTAHRATSSSVELIPSLQGGCRANVTIEYMAPLVTPGIGKLIGTKVEASTPYYAFPLACQIERTVDVPRRSTDRIEPYAMGIRYGEAQ